MSIFKVGLVQNTGVIGRKSENLANVMAWVKKAKEAGADLVCFPELGLTGHAGHPDMVKEAEPVPGGECVQALCAAARDLDIHICAGLAELDGGIHYNTQFIVGPEGYIGKQRKVHPSNNEYFYFRHGTKLNVMQLPFARVGIIICFDNLFPEISRCMALDGAEVLICPHAVRAGVRKDDPEERARIVQRNKNQWIKVHSGRAYDNGCYVLLSNMAGRSDVYIEDTKATHGGGCMAIDPNGDVMAESSARDIEEELVTVTLDMDAVAARRREVCFNLQVRRPELYGLITKPTE